MNPWLLLILMVGLASCADPRANVIDDTTEENVDDPSDTGEPSGSTTVVSETGGALSSEDGLFTIEIPPFILAEPVQITIENAAPTGVPSSFSALSDAYSVSIEPASALPSENVSIRISFRLPEDIALANDFDASKIYSQQETEEGITPWSLQETTTDVDSLALWSFVETPAQTFSVFVPATCACDVSDECDEGCECDDQCAGDPSSESDATDPTEPSDSADTSDPSTSGEDSSDPSDTFECSASEFECSDQACIPLIRLCDGLPDCNDASDELNCSGVSIQPDEYEPDNNFETANNIEAGEAQVHTLPDSDQDYYSFRTVDIQDVAIVTRGSSGDTTLTLYNESRSQIATETDGGSGNFARLESRSLPPGTYYFRVSNGVLGPTGIHTVELFTSDPLAEGPTGVSASMDGESVRVTWNSVAGAESYNVYYGLSLGGPYTANQATEGASPINTTETSLNLNGFIPESTIYIVVSAISGGIESYNSSEVSVFVPIPADIFEPNDSIEEAQPIESGVPQNHSISAGDEDYFTFTLEVPSSVVLRTSGSSGDSKLYLLNSEGTQLAYNDDGGDGLFSLISEDRLEAGVYYGYVSGYSTFTEIPAYQLSFTATSLIQIDAQEPNDTTSEATQLQGSTASGSLHTESDIDVYQVVVPENAEVNVGLDVTSGTAVVTLLDASGTPVATSQPTDAEGTTSLNVDRPQAGGYFIKIESTEGLVENYVLRFDALIYPTVPTDINVSTSADGTITLTWTSVPGATSYDVEYFYSGDLTEPNPANWNQAAEGTSPISVSTETATITGLPSVEPTYLRVRSLNGTATSEWSSTVSTSN